MSSFMGFLDPRARTALAVIGGLGAFYFIVAKFLPLLQRIYAYFCRPAKNLREYGEWAVVTGGTDGIGKAYCVELAQRGINILIISRSESKCQAVVKEFEEKFKNVKFTYLAIDFSSFDEKAREKVRTKIEGLDVGMLFNNVGYPGEHPKFIFERTEDEMTKHVDLNITNTIWMTKIILGDDKQGMLQRKRGAIINIGSMAGLKTNPLMTYYGAAKTYVQMMSRSLTAELADFGIHVQVQTPGRVISQLTASFAEKSLTFPDAETWVKSAIRHIGYEAHTHGYWPHELMSWAMMQVSQAKYEKDFMESHMKLRFQAMQEKKEKANTEKEVDALEMPLRS